MDHNDLQNNPFSALFGSVAEAKNYVQESLQRKEAGIYCQCLRKFAYYMKASLLW